MLDFCPLAIDICISKPMPTWRLQASLEATLRAFVEENDRCGVSQQRFLDDSPVVNPGRLDGTDGNHLLGQREIGRVEKEDPGLLVIEVP